MEEQAYRQARHRLDLFVGRDGDGIAPDCRSLLLEHGCATERVALLFHGLSASPMQCVALAEALHGRGYNVFVPRLPRHGHADRLSDVLSLLSRDELAAFADESLAIARGLGREVAVAGFSLGGLLAARAGQMQRVERVVAIAPFLGLAFLPNRLRLPIARWVLGRRNRFYWWDPFLRERQLPAHGYPRYATHAVAQALTLANELLADARARPPCADRLTVIINEHESTVSNRAIRHLAAAWRARKPNAVHVVVLRDLPYTHDILEPKRYPEIARRVLPVLVESIER